MSQPLVSVVLPAYNHERYIESSIRSVIDQDYEAIELVVINDGSRDRTDEVIRALIAECERRFVRFEYINKANEGVAITMNRGVEWARGEFVTSISSDDLMKPWKVSSLMLALENAGPDVGVAYGDADFIDDDGHPSALDEQGVTCDVNSGYQSFLSFYLRDRKDVKMGDDIFTYDALVRGNFLPGMAMAWRRSTLMAVGAFTPGIAIEDWDLWLKLVRVCRGLYVPRVVASYRWHQNNTVKSAVPRILEGQDYILAREFEYVRSNPVLARVVARMWLRNSWMLVRARRIAYALRMLRPDIWLRALRRV